MRARHIHAAVLVLGATLASAATAAPEERVAVLELSAKSGITQEVAERLKAVSCEMGIEKACGRTPARQ